MNNTAIKNKERLKVFLSKKKKDKKK